MTPSLAPAPKPTECPAWHAFKLTLAAFLKAPTQPNADAAMMAQQPFLDAMDLVGDKRARQVAILSARLVALIPAQQAVS